MYSMNNNIRSFKYEINVLQIIHFFRGNEKYYHSGVHKNENSKYKQDCVFNTICFGRAI